MGNPLFRLNPYSLNPPALTEEEDGVADEYPPWVLLESQAYVADCENATTAVSKTWDGHDIQVTICPRRPPRVSYLCVYSRDAEMPLEPNILAMEEDLVVLRVTVSCQKDVMKNIDYYVYRATGGVADGKPSLTLLKRPPSPYKSFYSENIGVLLCDTTEQPTLGGQTGLYLRPHVHGVQKHYIIAAFKLTPWEMQEEFSQGNFILSLYDSKKEDWTVHTVSLNKEQRQQYEHDFEHANSKVITIGGDAGTMGFVDLWRGILFCDLLSVKGEVIPSPLRYVELPSMRSNSMFRGDARLARDIAVINEQLKFVELRVHWKESRVCKGDMFEDGWMATTWIRSSSCLSGHWRKECKVDSKDMNFKDNPYVNLLPKVLSDEDVLLPPFKRIDICQPTLGLNDDDSCVVYFMTKVNRRDKDAWVVAVDMQTNTLQGVAPFVAARNTLITFAYMPGRISTHLLKTAPGPHGHLKRPRVLPQATGKRLSGMGGTSLVTEDGGYYQGVEFLFPMGHQ